jgi:hypothetical protein
MQMFNPGIETNQVSIRKSDLQACAFKAAQDQPDRVLLGLSDVTADADTKTVKVTCTGDVARALRLKRSQLLPDWSHEVVSH